MSSERVRLRLEDIIENADRIAPYTEAMSLTAFAKDRRTADAVERCLERIAEAVVQIGEAKVSELGLDLPWNEIRALGNRLRHEYRRIDARIIYDTIVEDVPALRAAVQGVLDR